MEDPIFKNLKNEIQSYLKTHEISAKPLSISALSQLILRRDHSISSCARDVIMKPLLSSGACLDSIKAEINEWQDLVMDTYLKLKEESNQKHPEGNATRATQEGANGDRELSIPQASHERARTTVKTGSSE